MQGNSPEEIRNDQIAHGRTTLGVKEGYAGKERVGNTEFRHGYRGENKSPSRPFKKHTPKGHDAILAKLQESRAVVRIFVITPDSDFIEGRVVGRDKFTITVQPTYIDDSNGYHDGEDRPITIYKHAIESFQDRGVVIPSLTITVGAAQ